MYKLGFLAGALLLISGSRNAVALPTDVLSEGRSFPSPDGRFVALYKTSPTTREFAGLEPRVPGSADYSDAEPKYELVQHSSELAIKDNLTGETEHLAVMTPLYSVRWAGDSKTLVATYHLSHFTGVYVMHLKSGKWQKHDVEPPLDDDFRACMLIQQGWSAKGVRLVYKVMNKAYFPETGRSVAECFICTYVVDTGSGTVTPSGKRRQIHPSYYARLRYYGDR